MSNIEEVRDHIIDGTDLIQAVPLAELKTTVERHSLDIVVDGIAAALSSLNHMQRTTLDTLMKIDGVRADADIARTLYVDAAQGSSSTAAVDMITGVTELRDHAQEASLAVHSMSDEAPNLIARLTAIAQELSTYAGHYNEAIDHIGQAAALRPGVVDSAQRYLDEVMGGQG